MCSRLCRAGYDRDRFDTFLFVVYKYCPRYSSVSAFSIHHGKTSQMKVHQSLLILQILWEYGVNISVEAQCQSRGTWYLKCPVTYLHSGVVSGHDRRSSIGFDVLFEQSEPQVHLFLAGTVDDDGIKADTCDMFRKGKCNASSAFSRQPSGAAANQWGLSSICFLRG